MNTYLGFDYGSTNVAIGEIVGDSAYTYFTKFDAGKDPYDIHMIIEGFMEGSLLGSYPYLKPNHYAFIETAFKGPNARTYQRMTRVGHSIYVLMNEYGNGVQVEYLDNNVWRKVLFGKGNTKKDVAQEAAYAWWPQLLDLPKSQRGHCADALLIAAAGKKIIEGRANEQKACQQFGSKEHK